MSPLKIKWVNIVTLLFLLTASISPTAINANLSVSHGKENKSLFLETFDENDIFLPIIIKDYTGPPTIFGAETNVPESIEILDMARSANIYWVRSQVFSWDLIEPVDTTPTNYHWEYVDGDALIDASARRLHVIATIKMTPYWAQKYKGVYCGPIARDYFADFAEFLEAVVKTYGSPPYNVKYWELGNEPDVDRNLVPADSQFGCWGEDNQANYGGEYYADMLKVAYPAIKSADPEAKVLIGGLLLDCDPTNPPPDKSCKPGKFLQGILENGGARYFDIVNFHGYAYYAIYQDLTKTYPQYLFYDEHHPYWIDRGGVILGKIDFLREVMNNYGVSKPIIASEAALLCSGAIPCDSLYEEAKANYIVWLYVRNLAAGVLGTTWYTIEWPGWRNASLLDASQNPRPAYYVLDFLTSELQDTTYKGMVVLYPKLRGYEFGNKSKRVWVLWAPDEQPYLITLPVGATNVYDKYGVPIIPEANQITVMNPVFIELPP